MKKHFIFIMATFAILFLILYVSVQNKAFNINKYKINEYIHNPINAEYFNSYFVQNGQYPNSIFDLISKFKDSGAPQEAVNEIFCDPFSSANNYWHYLPLYNKQMGTAEGFILLSAGIDGEIDNRFKDSLYVDGNISLKLYSSADTGFNILDKWFGQKDILIMKRNGKDMLKESAGYNPPNINIQPWDRIKTIAMDVKGRPHLRVAFHFLYKDKIILKNDTCIFFHVEDLWIKNVAYDPNDFISFQINDSILLAGILTGRVNDSTIEVIRSVPLSN